MPIKIEPDQIQMIAAKVIRFNLENNIPTEQINGYEFRYSATSRPDLNESQVYVDLYVDVSADTLFQEGESPVAQLQFAFAFRVEVLERLVKHTGKMVNIIKELDTALTDISYQTARGMIISRGAGTLLEEAFLPVNESGSLV